MTMEHVLGGAETLLREPSHYFILHMRCLETAARIKVDCVQFVAVQNLRPMYASLDGIDVSPRSGSGPISMDL